MKNKLKKQIGSYLRNRGYKMWPTKPFEIWLLLFNLLKVNDPDTILEIGSGRSTNFLAEFAYKKKKKFISIEQNKNYVKKINRQLKQANIPNLYVNHVPIVDDWFCPKSLDNIITNELFDFVFIDAPGGSGNTSGRRDSQVGLNSILKVVKDNTLIVIDDTDREEVLKTLPKLVGMRKCITIDYKVSGNDTLSSISFLVPEASYHLSLDLAKFCVKNSPTLILKY